MKVSLIAAVAQNGVIGHQNRLPWRLPEDLRRFKQVTLGHPIVMGRKTYESLGRPLPERENWVLTRQAALVAPGARVASTLAEVIQACAPRAAELFVIGGAEIYAMALDAGLVDRVYLTRVMKDFEGDAYFPRWSEFMPPSKAWRVLQDEGVLEPFPHRYLVLERR